MDEFLQQRSTLGKICGIIGVGALVYGLLIGESEYEQPLNTAIWVMGILGFLILKNKEKK
tara:strand:+ start:401 stop:580 length:180 start_codon:yes stop_codon:yes gene_type:complete